MAKTQKFKDDLLLEAIIKYSEVHRGKIKATELAEWSRNNIVGLEDVRDYHFTRPVRIRDEKTGKVKEVSKLCTQRMNEINKARSIGQSVKTNVLLRSVKVDALFELPLSEQRKLVVETRETVDELLRRNQSLQREVDALRKVNKIQQEEIEQISHLTKSIKKEQNRLSAMVNYIKKSYDEEQMKEKLAEIGIKDGDFDINQYLDSIGKNVGKMQNDIKDLLKYYNQFEDDDSDILEQNDMVDFILDGINFD